MTIYHECREDMLRFIVDDGWNLGEVGVFLGDFSAFMLSLQPAELHLIDPFHGVLVSGDRDGNAIRTCQGDDAFRYVHARFENDDIVSIHREWSPNGILQFARGYFDLLYLDGDHTYNGAKKDLAAALTRVKPGGYICGHDYDRNAKKCPYEYKFGVRRAVDELCALHNLQIAHVAQDGYMSFAIQIPDH